MSDSAQRVVVLSLSLLLLPAPNLFLASGPTSLLAQSTAERSRQSSLTELEAVRRHVFQGTNERRRAHDREPLAPDSSLASLACLHSRDMLVRDFFEHENPDGQGPGDRSAHHHRRLIGGSGENICAMEGDVARTLPAEVMADSVMIHWMNSPSHRDEILRQEYTHMGVCALRQGDRIRVTQSFAQAQGFLTGPLPDSVRSRTTLDITVEPYPEYARPPKYYDFWDPDQNRRLHPPLPVRDSISIPDTTGTYRFRALFPLEEKENRYEYFFGPWVTILPAPKS